MCTIMVSNIINIFIKQRDKNVNHATCQHPCYQLVYIAKDFGPFLPLYRETGVFMSRSSFPSE